MVPSALCCKGRSKPIVLQISELGRNSHKAKAKARIVAVGIEFLNTLFIELWNGKWIWSVLKNSLSHGLFGITSRVAIEGCKQTTRVWLGSQFHQSLSHTTQPGWFSAWLKVLFAFKRKATSYWSEGVANLISKLEELTKSRARGVSKIWSNRS